LKTKKHRKLHFKSAPKAKRTKMEYRCIDGNWTYHPSGICTFYQGVLTNGLERTHQCRKKHCKRFREGYFE